MRIIEAVTVQTELDPWLNLEALSQYAGLSARSLRYYLRAPEHPLPHYRMQEPHVIQEKAGEDGMEGRKRTVSGKILVRRSDFDAWMARFRHATDVDKVVDEVMAGWQSARTATTPRSSGSRLRRESRTPAAPGIVDGDPAR